MNCSSPIAIFDLDGTLIDSIPFWNHLGQDYLISRGCTPEDRLELRLLHMSLPESAEYFRKEYLPRDSADDILAGIMDFMEENYKNRIPAKAGSPEYVRRLKDAGIRMAVCSTSPSHLIRAVLDRLGILSCFDVIVSCQEVGVGKHSPAAYLLTMERLGVSDPSLCTVYEDAFFAMETAKSCGMKVIGVYDAGCEKSPEEVSALCDGYIRDYTVCLR